MFLFSDDSMRNAFKNADKCYCPNLMVSVKNEYSEQGELLYATPPNAAAYSCPMTLYMENPENRHPARFENSGEALSAISNAVSVVEGDVTLSLYTNCTPRSVKRDFKKYSEEFSSDISADFDGENCFFIHATVCHPVEASVNVIRCLFRLRLANHIQIHLELHRVGDHLCSNLTKADIVDMKHSIASAIHIVGKTPLHIFLEDDDSLPPASYSKPYELFDYRSKLLGGFGAEICSPLLFVRFDCLESLNAGVCSADTLGVLPDKPSLKFFVIHGELLLEIM